MATARKLSLVLILCMICAQKASGLGPVIDVHPAEIQVDHTDTLDIVCTFNIDSTPTMAAIISLIISWSIDSGAPFTEVAAITEFSPHTVNQLTNANVSGVGFLSEDGESYLHLEWKFPSELQAGVYQCAANGVDKLGHNLVMDASAQVTVKGADTAHCMDTLDAVTKNVSSLEQIVTNMENYTKTLELKLAEMENYTKALEEKLAGVGQCSEGEDFYIYGMRYKCHNYYLSNGYGFEVHNATETCKRFGGYLAEINDYDEYHAIQSFLRNTTGLDWVLVGGTDEGHEGKWTLPSSNETLPVVDWLAATGGSHGVTTNCLVLDEPSWRMRDEACLNAYDTDRFMCEFP